MKKLYFLFVALIATCALWAGNVITYTASEKLVETTRTYGLGLHTNAFNVSITSHIFSDGVGTITFDGEVMSIGDNAFEECSSLTSVTIPESVTNIGSSAFYGCSRLTSITIPESVMNIGDDAFYGCSQLTSITIPKNVTRIGSAAFFKCSSLTSIFIPESVTSIGTYVFAGCSSLTSIAVASGNTAFDSRNNCNAIISTSSNNLVVGCKNTIIPNSVTSIGGYAFYNCSGLVSVTIPDGVTSIGNNAFSGCSLLTSITIPDGVTSIGRSAFAGCSSLTSVTIPNGVTSIKEGTFNYCSNLVSVTIPESVVSIESDAFNGCSALTNVNLPNGLQSIGNTAFGGCSFSSITIPNSVTYIGTAAFRYCERLTSVSIPESITKIENATFQGCELLSKIVLPHGLLTIGQSAFKGCKSLTEVVIPDGVKEIGGDAFRDCPSITSITLGKSLTKIEGHAFDGSEKIKVLKFPASLIEIGVMAFSTYPSPIDSVYVYNTIQTMKSPTIISNLVVYMSPFDMDDDSAVKQTILNNKDSRTNLIRKVSPAATQIASIGPTTAEIVVDLTGYNNLPDSLSLDLEDDEYPLSHGVTRVVATGLNPNTTNQFRFYSKKAGETNWTDGQPLEIKTSTLTLKTENPKIVTAGQALVSATTNISDLETNVGFEWRKTDAPAEMASKRGNAIVFQGAMEGKLQNLGTTSYWKVRAYYQANDETEYYGDWVTFDPSDFSYFEPTVRTATLSSAPTDNSVTVRGYVMTGTDNITEQGFEYWFSTPKGTSRRIASATPDSVYRVTATGQIMTATLSDLAYSTQYTCRAYAVAGGKTYYGEEVHFLTAEDPRPIVTLTLTQPENGSINTDAGGEYREGDTVTLIATPDEGYTFEAWSDGATDNPYTLIITEDLVLTAVFKEGVVGIHNTECSSRAVKYLQDGQLLIRRGGNTYTIQGAVVK